MVEILVNVRIDILLRANARFVWKDKVASFFFY